MSQFFSKTPWSNRSHDENTSQKSTGEGDSLITILPTQEDRSSLTILVAESMEAMRQSIEDVFDANQTGEEGDVVDDTEADIDEADNAEANELFFDQDEEKAQSQKQEQERLRQELAKRKRELSRPKMLDLKAAALKHFDDWRVDAIERIGEAVNAREPSEQRQTEETSSKSSQSQTSGSEKHLPDLPPYDEGVGEAMLVLYPPIDTPLVHLSEDKRALILHSVLLLLLSLEHYQAQSRILLLRLCTSLNLPVSLLATNESKVAQTLLTAAESMQADEETKKKAAENSTARKWKVGLAAVAGAALIGVTGGLAAPLLAAGIGSVMGGLGLGATAAAGYLGTLAGSGVLVGSLFGAYGGRMTGKAMDKYARDVEDFAFVPIRTSHQLRRSEKERHRLRVAIGISGWLTDQKEVVKPWKPIGEQLEAFALRWELEALMKLGNAITAMVTSVAWSFAKVEIIKRTVFASLTAGLWPLALTKISRVIDNPFTIAHARAQKAGEVLADALINKAQGERPVTLIGYSLGAKVIFVCLQRLAERRAFGLVESVVLLGTPAPSTSADWRVIRSVVSGRVVNVFSVNDYILAFLYRSSSIQFGVAGLQPIRNVKGVENVDVSESVSGHTRYRFLTGPILKQIGFEDVDIEELKREEKELQEQEAREEQERREHENKEKPKASVAVGPDDVSDEQVKALEEEIEEKNQKSFMGWAQTKMMAAGSSASAAYGKARSQFTTRDKPSDMDASSFDIKGIESGNSVLMENTPVLPADAPVVATSEEPDATSQDVDEARPRLPMRPK